MKPLRPGSLVFAGFTVDAPPPLPPAHADVREALEGAITLLEGMGCSGTETTKRCRRALKALIEQPAKTMEAAKDFIICTCGGTVDQPASHHDGEAQQPGGADGQHSEQAEAVHDALPSKAYDLNGWITVEKRIADLEAENNRLRALIQVAITDAQTSC